MCPNSLSQVFIAFLGRETRPLAHISFFYVYVSFDFSHEGSEFQVGNHQIEREVNERWVLIYVAVYFAAFLPSVYRLFSFANTN